MGEWVNRASAMSELVNMQTECDGQPESPANGVRRTKGLENNICANCEAKGEPRR
uniref:Uncharacterized protein n=1 Tax=Cucumis melo TaxID=3656 RepID=A0A9I9DW06_CUCME